MILDEYAEVKWNGMNKKHFESLGYIYTKLNEVFMARVSDLPPSSSSMVNIDCDQCGKNDVKEYGRLKNKKITFCSHECSNIYKQGKEIKKRSARYHLECSHCEKKFVKPEYHYLHQQENHFCSKECFDKFRVGKPNYKNRTSKTVECYHCKTEIERPPNRIESNKRQFCDMVCRSEWQKSDEFKAILKESAKPAETMLIECDNCNEEFEKRISHIRGKLTFCNTECRNEYFVKNNPNPKKDKIKVFCFMCDTKKYVPESVFKKNMNFFCTEGCYHIWIKAHMNTPEQVERARINAVNILSGGFISTDSTIQQTINLILDSNEIEYINEYNCKYYAIDNYLPDHKLMIEVMGDYWHSNPIKYKDKELLNKTQVKRVYADRRKNTYIKNKYNVNVLYLWEEDIRKSPLMCEKLISLYIHCKGSIDSFHSFNYELDENNKLKLKDNIIKPYF